MPGRLARPVWFFSRMFNSYQLNYSAVEKEALALIWAVKHIGLRWVRSSSIQTITHDLSVFYAVSKQETHTLFFFFFLEGFARDIWLMKGTENVMADALSRAPADEPHFLFLPVALPFSTILGLVSESGNTHIEEK